MSPTSTSPLPPKETLTFVQKKWQDDVLPTLARVHRIPAKSPGFDVNGRLTATWTGPSSSRRAGRASARSRASTSRSCGCRTGRRCSSWTFPAPAPDTVLLYGHLDKQPEMVGWGEGLGPWTPVRRGDRLYGRGAADDGYAAFAALTADRGAAGARACRTRAASSSSRPARRAGAPTCPPTWTQLAERIGDPEPRGVPRRGLRQLRPALDHDLAPRAGRRRAHGGGARARACTRARERHRAVELPDRAPAPLAPRGRADGGDPAARPPRRDPARARRSRRGRWPRCSATTSAAASRSSPGMRPAHADPIELVLARTWRPALAITGADGIPPSPTAATCCGRGPPLKLSLRVPPTLDAPARRAPAEGDRSRRTRRTARACRFTPATPSPGWDAPATWPAGSRSRSSAPRRRTSGGPPMSTGVGGSIPFMSHARRAVPPRAVPDHGRARPRARTRTGPTSSSTSRRASGSPPASPRSCADHYRDGRS